jgi:DNA-binding NarL/FixJ family response regulator
MLKFLVVEDHALVREGLVGLLAQVEDDVRVFDSADFETALSILDNEGEFDLALLDLALPGIDGFAGLDILRRRYPAMPVVVVSAFDDLPTVTRVLNLGASGFIPKALNGEGLLQAVREVLAGNIYRPSGQVLARMDDVAPVPNFGVSVRPEDIGLTVRQAQVLCLMVRGLSNRDIADQLDLSEGTVKIHATAVFKVLGVGSRTQAVVTAGRYSIDFSDVF